MTNADNMFYSLGYYKREEDDEIEFQQLDVSIYFYLETKDFKKQFNDNEESAVITMQELKAINEKVKELRMV